MQINLVFFKVVFVLITSEATRQTSLEDLRASKIIISEPLNSFEQDFSHNPPIHNGLQVEQVKYHGSQFDSMQRNQELNPLNSDVQDWPYRGKSLGYHGSISLLDQTSTSTSIENDEVHWLSLEIDSKSNCIQPHHSSSQYIQSHRHEYQNCESTGAPKTGNLLNYRPMTYNRFDQNGNLKQHSGEMNTADYDGRTQSNLFQKSLMSSRTPLVPENHLNGPISLTFPHSPQTNAFGYHDSEPCNFKQHKNVSN